MALKQDMVTVSGIKVPGAYRRVEGITIIGKTEINFQVRSYNDVTLPAFADESHSCPYAMGGSNPFDQAYVYLKTLPEFAGAVDC